jgi:hypothetical protein
MNKWTISSFEGGPEGAALEVLKRFKDDRKSLTLKEAMVGSGMSWRNAKNALEVLLEYNVPLLTREPLQNAERKGDDTAYKITAFGKEYLTWSEGKMEMGAFAQLRSK